MQNKSSYSLFHRFFASVLIILHLVTFGPIKDALAFTSQSTSYKLSSAALNEGGNERSTTAIKLWQDALGESWKEDLKRGRFYF